jgi:HlyD family secretion protein
VTASRRVAIVIVLAAAAVAVGATLLARNQGQRLVEFQGWVEAQLIFVGPDEAGRIDTLAVREGDQVKAGALLFALDADLQRAAVAENEAAVANARQAYDRAKSLLKSAVGTQKAFDEAQAVLRTAEARLHSARTRLERRGLNSPVSGTVQEVYFRQGELVQPGRPIVSLLPPGNIRVRFFIPQAELPKVKLGDLIAVKCDGCAADLVARVNFISAQAEFTPPVIYSQEERARLVFRVEAIPERPADLRVGQPVSVALEPTAATSHAYK